MRKRREIGSARVGERLAKNQLALTNASVNNNTTTETSNRQNEPSKRTTMTVTLEQSTENNISNERPYSLISTPPSSVTSDPIHDRKLLPQRGQQRRTVKSQKRR